MSSSLASSKTQVGLIIRMEYPFDQFEGFVTVGEHDDKRFDNHVVHHIFDIEDVVR